MVPWLLFSFYVLYNNEKHLFACSDLPDPSIWDKIKEYYLKIPILFRFILLTLSSICLVLFCICMCLCLKDKCAKRKMKKKYQKGLKKALARNVNSVSRDYLSFKDAKD